MDESAARTYIVHCVSDDSDEHEETPGFHTLSRTAPVETLEGLSILYHQNIPVIFDNHVVQDASQTACRRRESRGWDRVDAFLEFATTTNYIQGISAHASVVIGRRDDSDTESAGEFQVYGNISWQMTLFS